MNKPVAVKHKVMEVEIDDKILICKAVQFIIVRISGIDIFTTAFFEMVVHIKLHICIAHIPTYRNHNEILCFEYKHCLSYLLHTPPCIFSIPLFVNTIMQSNMVPILLQPVMFSCPLDQTIIF